MKKLKEELLRKDSSISKIQYDKEWFYNIKDMAHYLSEDLTNVDYIHLPIVINGIQRTVKCATLEDIKRALKKNALQDFSSSRIKR
ncbi:hypothetical protein [Flavobacterium litorale]|uniref:Uncharacterized protein n=1 Tax=Flavobacterium litorale TaxID=2856519 RepID=A0ABX8V635_9FLAO|nr:hypothetical protein [Flavobacterium litorale]QYJ68298.1 hypothetical protein K1I41_12365 [Flavobacterium litorale]